MMVKFYSLKPSLVVELKIFTSQNEYGIFNDVVPNVAY